MATYTIGDGSALGFPFAPGSVGVVRKTINFAALPAGTTANIADVLNVIPVPPGALLEAAVCYVKTVDAAGAAAVSLNDSAGVQVASFSVAAVGVPGTFSTVAQKFYPSGDYLNLVMVKALTTAVIEVVAVFSNVAA